MLLNINDSTFKVKVAVSEKETQKGMMGKKFNEDFNGMLFIMDGDEHCFWMNNCIIPLDIIFIEGDTISRIHHNCEPCKGDDCINYCGLGNIILEVEGGTCERNNINEGDTVYF